MPKVFIVNQAGHDFDKAKKFGELVYVTTGNINVFRPDRTFFSIKESLSKFTKDDYLLLSGNTFGNVLAALAAVENINKINLLVYDAKNLDYLHHVLDLERLIFVRTNETPYPKSKRRTSSNPRPERSELPAD